MEDISKLNILFAIEGIFIIGITILNDKYFGNTNFIIGCFIMVLIIQLISNIITIAYNFDEKIDKIIEGKLNGDN